MARTPQKRRCTGKRSNGEPCRAWAIKGGTVCVTHGGAAPQVKRKAVANLAVKRAQRMVELAGVDMDPIQHLLDCLHRAATLVHVWGIMVATLDEDSEDRAAEGEFLRGELHYRENTNPRDPDVLTVTTSDHLLGFNHKGEAAIHPFVTEYNRALEMRAKFAKMCIDAGVTERQMQLAERIGEQLSMVFERTMAAIKGLSEAQRLQAAKAFAGVIAELERPTIDGTARRVA